MTASTHPTFVAYAPPRDAGTVNGWTVKEHPSARPAYRFQAVRGREVRSAPTIGGLGIATAAAPRAALSRASYAMLAALGIVR